MTDLQPRLLLRTLARDAAHAAALGRPFRALLAARLDLGHRLDLVDQPRRVPPNGSCTN